MAYWWASQNSNYPLVIEAGTLWTKQTRNGRNIRARTFVREMRVGDLVFHYRGPAIRALSIVTHEWVDYQRPLDYSQNENENETESEDMGWLVRVEPLERSLHIHRDRVAELLVSGSPGPLDVRGIPQRKYITRLDDEEGQVLLDEMDSHLPDPVDWDKSADRMIPGRPHEDWLPDETDARAVRAIRREQRYLRKHLLNANENASCSMCRRDLPEDMLIAGHIKRRSQCTSNERMDFDSAAMLICLLGCDSLFERGLIVVDDTGTIRGGRPAGTHDLRVAVSHLVGMPCSAWNVNSRSNFGHHRESVVTIDGRAWSSRTELQT